MHKTCKCGFMMSDTTVPNHTVLWVFDEPNSTSHSFTFYHCECCHRLYKYPSRVDNCYYIMALREVIPSFPESAEDDYRTVYIQNDYDEEFKGYLAHDNRKLLLEYHGKTVLFLTEEIYDGDKLIYHDEAPKIILFDPVSIDRSVTTKHIRCSCGWMIAQEYFDDDSVINLYDDTSWELDFKSYFGDKDMEGRYTSDFTGKGLFCEKCSRLMLPNEDSQFIVYEPIQEQIKIDAAFSFLWYFVKPIELTELEDKFCSDRESYLKLPKKFNRIYISVDKKHLRVHIGDTVVYYQAEKDE